MTYWFSQGSIIRIYGHLSNTPDLPPGRSGGLLDHTTHAFGALLSRIGDLVVHGDELEHALDALLKKFLFHILQAARQEEVHADAVALGEPFTRFLRLEHEVMVAGAELDLHSLDLG